MSIRKRKFGTDRLGDYDRLMLRSAFVSLFWATLQDKGKQLKFLAKELRVDKSAISRWFSSNPPNMQVDTISDIARALDLEIRITATPRDGSPKIYTPSGVQVTKPESLSKEAVTENPAPSVQSRIVTKPPGVNAAVETTGR
jgi:transcriptional regulator with XRE-family HTH domain